MPRLLDAKYILGVDILPDSVKFNILIFLSIYASTLMNSIFLMNFLIIEFIFIIFLGELRGNLSAHCAMPFEYYDNDGVFFFPISVG